jgi:hypothetical protein
MEFPDADENLGALLYAGVTTVLDAAALTPAIFATRDEIRSGKKLGPRLFAAGPMFTGPGGHPVGIMRETLPFWVRWYVVAHLTRQEATPDEARRVAESSRSIPTCSRSPSTSSRSSRASAPT